MPEPAPAPPDPSVPPGDDARLLGAVAAVAGVWSLALLLLQLARLGRFQPASFDLAIYAQLTWAAGGGSAMSSIQQAPSLGVHWSPILLLLGPLARLFGPVGLLLALQALALGAMAPLLFLAARPHLPGRAAAALGLTALAYAPAWTLALNGFHPEVLGCPLALGLWLALQRGRAGLTLGLALALGLLLHEVWPLCLLGLGSTELLPGRRRRLGLALCGLGALLFLLEVGVFLPAARQGAIGVDRYYAHLGQGALGAALSPVLRPGAFWGHVLGPRALLWAGGLLLGVGFVALRRPLLLLPALPVYALMTASSRATQQDLAFHYHAALVPWLLLAATQAVALAAPERRRWLAPLLGLGLGLGLLTGPEPAATFAELGRPRLAAEAVKPALLARIPAEAPAAGSVDLLHELAAREALWGLPGIVRGTKDHSQVPYAAPPAEAWLLVDTADAASFWGPGAPAGLVGPASARWRALVLDPARGWLGGAGGTLLLGPGGLPVLEPWQTPTPAGPPRLHTWAPGLAEDQPGVLGGFLHLVGPDGPVPPLWLEVFAGEAQGPLRSLGVWPALYRLYDFAPWPARGLRVRLALPLPPGTARVRLALRLGHPAGPVSGAPLDVAPPSR